MVLSNQLPFGARRKKERKKGKIGGLLEGKSETAKIATREIEEFEKTLEEGKSQKKRRVSEVALRENFLEDLINTV